MREGVGGAKRVADLFAGLGTFTFALARDAAVDAFEADEAALHALAEAARKTPKLKPVRRLAAICFTRRSAPRSCRPTTPWCSIRRGQALRRKPRRLPSQSVPRLVAVSCNPGTLARDLRILVDGGYRIARIVPVDQFLFSPHIEIVAHLER